MGHPRETEQDTGQEGFHDSFRLGIGLKNSRVASKVLKPPFAFILTLIQTTPVALEWMQFFHTVSKIPASFPASCTNLAFSFDPFSGLKCLENQQDQTLKIGLSPLSSPFHPIL